MTWPLSISTSEKKGLYAWATTAPVELQPALRAVIDLCDETGVNHVNTSDLAESILWPETAFCQALVELEQLGLISRLRRHHKRGKPAPDVIQVLPITAMTAWVGLVDSASRSR